MTLIDRPRLPTIIQGGMGVGVSNWRLARAVGSAGGLGVVSGTALDTLLVRRLQDGDPGGHMRRAMARFPVPSVADEVLRKFFRPGGRSPNEPYALLPLYNRRAGAAREQLTMLANFVEVDLAREGHDGPVGINLLTKLQMPNMPSLYGAMLAGVDAVLMGAGIPREIPGILDRLSRNEPATQRLHLDEGEPGDDSLLTFDPAEHMPGAPPPLTRPDFLAIVSTETLASVLDRKATGRVDGFIVEGPTAGGHNAPPRDRTQWNTRGEPVYGDRDMADLGRIRKIGRPFWLAGGTGSPDGLARARAAGAAGIQVGTLFAYCEESGVDPDLRSEVVRGVAAGGLDVFTDPRASPTGFPFKVVDVDGSVGREDIYEDRDRICDLGYLRSAYRRPDGRIGYRCPAEPVDQYLAKGGTQEDTVGRKCLCNGLVATVGHGQLRGTGGSEPPLVTSGDGLADLRNVLDGRSTYSAGDVLRYLS